MTDAMLRRMRVGIVAGMAAVPLALCALLGAATTGSISGLAIDPSGAVIPGATLTVTNITTGVQSKTTSNENGFYSFPSLTVGRYDLMVESAGFTPQKRTGLVIDADSALQIDMTLTMIEKIEEVTVLANEVNVETTSTQLGQVVTTKAITAVALNGRSFTDLLALQPGIVPMTTQQPESIVMRRSVIRCESRDLEHGCFRATRIRPGIRRV